MIKKIRKMIVVAVMRRCFEKHKRDEYTYNVWKKWEVIQYHEDD